MSTAPSNITQLLHKWRPGDQGAESRLFELLLPGLRRIARRCFRGERPGHTLQPTALVNEAFPRLAAAKNIDFQDRGHFLALAAKVMRRHLTITRARGQGASSCRWMVSRMPSSRIVAGWNWQLPS